MTQSVFPLPAAGDLSGNLVAGLIGNNVIDAFAVADNNNITGQLLRDLIGVAFEPHRNLATMNAVAASATAMNAVAASATAMNVVVASTVAMNVVAASAVAMNAVAASATAMNIVAASSAAMNIVAASATAMNAVAASATAMDAIWASSTAWNIVSASNMAVGKYVAGRAGQNAALFADMNAVAASAVAMDAVAASTVAMNAVVASATALNSIIKVASASVTITSAIQSRRATIITTMNAAPALFTRHVNQQLNVSATTGNFDVANNTNTFIIPLSQARSNGTYTLFSLANVAQIHQFVGNDGTVNISTGVALRGLRVHRSHHSGMSDITTYDMYTAV